MSKTVEIIISAKDQATSKLKGISAALASVGQQALSFGVAQLGVAGFSAAVDKAGEAFVGYNAKMEQAAIGFETMLGSAAAAKTFLQDMSKFAAETPFELPQVQDAAKKFIAFGWAAKDVIPTLTAVGNASAGLGMGADGIQRITMALGQMRAKGRVQGEELLQLAEAGIPAYQILGEKLKLTGEQVAKIGDQGVSADKAIRALVEGMNERFPDMMRKQATTFTGIWSTVKDNFGMIFGELGKPLFDQLKNILTGVKNWSDAIANTLREGGLSKAFENLIPADWQKRIEHAFDVFTRGGETLGKFGNTVYDVVIQYDLMGKAFDASIITLDAIVTAFENLAAGFDLLSIAMEDLVKDINFYMNDKMVGYFTSAFSAAYEISSAIFDKINENIFSKVNELVIGVAERLLPLQDAFAAIGRLIGATSDQFNAEINRMAAGKGPGNAITLPDGKVVIGGTDEMKVPLGPLSISGQTYGATPSVKPKPQTFREWLATYSASVGSAGRDKLNSHIGTPGLEFGDKGGKGAGKIDRITNQIQDAFEKLNQQIVQETGTAYELGTARVNDELAKMQRELIEKAQTLGIDTGALEAKMTEYARVMTEPIKRAQAEALKQLQGETAVITAKILGDKKAQAEAEYQIAVDGLEKERREKFKAVAQDQNDAAAKLAIDTWYAQEKKALEQKRQEEKRQAQIEEYDAVIENNQLDFDLRLKSQQEINLINREVLDKKIAFLNEELKKEGLTIQQIIEYRKQLVKAQETLDNSPTSAAGAFGAGLKDQLKAWGDWFKNLEEIGKQTAQSMQAAFSDFFFDAMTGKLKDLGDYVKSFLQGVARAISNALANMFAQKIIGSLFGGLFGKADGGPVYAGQPYVVGEHGRELFVPSGNGTIVPNSALSRSGAAPSVTVNVHNNTGTQAEVRQETKFDGQRMLVNVFLDAVAKNIGGIRTVLQGAR